MSGSIGNPQIVQGVLNLTRVNVQVANYPALNITASFLGSGGVTLTPGGPATTMINQLTGRVGSPEPYQPMTVGIHLIRSQGLAASWESQRTTLTAIGSILVFSDAAAAPTYSISNCFIENVGEQTFNGKSTEYFVTLTGTYIINNALWSAVI